MWAPYLKSVGQRKKCLVTFKNIIFIKGRQFRPSQPHETLYLRIVVLDPTLSAIFGMYWTEGIYVRLSSLRLWPSFVWYVYSGNTLVAKFKKVLEKRQKDLGCILLSDNDNIKILKFQRLKSDKTPNLRVIILAPTLGAILELNWIKVQSLSRLSRSDFLSRN